MTLPQTNNLSTKHLNIHTSSPLHESLTLIIGSETWNAENASYIKKLKPSESRVVTTGLHVSTSVLLMRPKRIHCVVFPLIYHDISEEIPEASRPLITRLYLLWLILAGTLIVNMVACIFVLTSGGSDGVKDLIVSIMCVPAWNCVVLAHSRSFGQHGSSD
jgi:SCAMP family